MPSLIATVRSCLGITIPNRTLGLFFDSLAVQLNCGRPISESLMSAAINSTDIELQEIMSAVGPKLQSGRPLRESLLPYAHRFPEIVLCVLDVGEHSGGLADSAERLADMFKLMQRAQRDLSIAAYDPKKILLIVCLIQTIFLICQALGPGQHNDSIAGLIVSIAASVALIAASIVAGYFLLRAAMRLVYRWKSLRLIVDTIKLALPGIGIISRNLSAARWARSFAVLWGAGVNISTALEVSSASALNAHYERELKMAAVQTRQGRSLTECLARTQLLPPFLLSVIRVCETAGRMDDQLIRIAADLERDALSKAIVQMNRTVVAAQMVIIAVAVIYMLSQLGSAL